MLAPGEQVEVYATDHAYDAPGHSSTVECACDRQTPDGCMTLAARFGLHDN